MFGKLFGKKDPVVRMEKALQQGRFADLLLDAEDIDRSSLDPSAQAKIDAMVATARERVCAVNIEEAEASINSGEMSKAYEHLELAVQFAQTPEQHQAIARLKGSGNALNEEPVQQKAAGGGHDCASCSGHVSTPAVHNHDELDEDGDLDTEARFELIISQYPDTIADLYGKLCGTMVNAVLAGHTGDVEGALKLLDSVPAEERGTIWHFERGLACADKGEVAAARAAFAQASTCSPEIPHFRQQSLDYRLKTGGDATLKGDLQAGVEDQETGPFCRSRLAQIYAAEGDLETAANEALAAINAGYHDPQVMLLGARILEKLGNVDGAEKLFAKMPGGGCSGGNIYLADFWLRHRKNLDKALEVFKSALRKEPENAEMGLKLAQVYAAKGWKKDVDRLVNTMLASPGLPPQIRSELQQLVVG